MDKQNERKTIMQKKYLHSVFLGCSILGIVTQPVQSINFPSPSQLEETLNRKRFDVELRQHHSSDPADVTWGDCYLSEAANWKKLMNLKKGQVPNVWLRCKLKGQTVLSYLKNNKPRSFSLDFPGGKIPKLQAGQKVSHVMGETYEYGFPSGWSMKRADGTLISDCKMQITVVE